MEIKINTYGRYDISGIQDAIPGKKYRGIAGYCKLIGWILSKLGFAIAFRDSQNKVFYLNKKSTVHWLNRNHAPLAEKAPTREIIARVYKLANAFILGGSEFPAELVHRICHFLLAADIARLKRVKKGFKEIAENALFDPKELAYNLNHFLQQAKEELAGIHPIRLEGLLLAGPREDLDQFFLAPELRAQPKLRAKAERRLKKLADEKKNLRDKALEPLEKFIIGLISHNRLTPAALNPLPVDQKQAIAQCLREIEALFTSPRDWLPIIREVADRLAA